MSFAPVAGGETLIEVDTHQVSRTGEDCATGRDEGEDDPKWTCSGEPFRPTPTPRWSFPV